MDNLLYVIILWRESSSNKYCHGAVEFCMLIVIACRGHSTQYYFSDKHSSAITDHDRQNSGKATVLGDAARVLRDLITQVESLRKEQSTLLTERQYVSFEKLSAYILAFQKRCIYLCSKFKHFACSIDYCVSRTTGTIYRPNSKGGQKGLMKICQTQTCLT